MDQTPLPTARRLTEPPKDRPPSSIPWRKLLLLLLFGSGLVAFFALGGNQFFSFAALKAHRIKLHDYAQHHYWISLSGAVALYTGSVALSLPIAAVLSLAVGFLFGRWVGTAIIVLSATLGATLVFLAARYLFAEAVQRRMGLLGQKMMAGFQENDFHYLLFLRLVPLFPFWLVNLAPAFTPIRARTYAAATAIGTLPASFIFAHLGQSLGEISSPGQLLSAKTTSALLLLGLLALLPVLAKRWQSRRARMGQGT
ncbi:MAG: VTT domain-containing protein [bacterium]